MPRTLVEVITDDFTGEKHDATEVEDVVLKFGYEEWKLVLTPASRQKIRELLDPFTKLAPCKDTTPSWTKVRAATETSTDASPPTVTVVPPDTPTVRRWWRDLTPTELRALDLPPAKTNGKLPDDVMTAFVEAHKPVPASAPTPAFSG